MKKEVMRSSFEFAQFEKKPGIRELSSFTLLMAAAAQYDRRSGERWWRSKNEVTGKAELKEAREEGSGRSLKRDGGKRSAWGV